VSAPSVNSNPERPRRLLVVDDNDASRYATVRILRAAGFEIVQAATGTDTLALLASNDIDLAVLDVNLPDIDGFQICRELRSRRETADLPIIYLSATFTASEDVARGLRTGADSYLTHPADPVVLVATVRALLFVRDAHAEKRHADARFRALFDLAPNGICMLDRALTFTEVNPALAALLGLEPAQLIGKRLTSFTAEEQPAAIEALQEALRGSKRWTGVTTPFGPGRPAAGHRMAVNP
jgi:PAS domain S-box-containing protein